jgi:hypothetical protein
VVVVSVPEYKAWLDRQSDDLQQAQEAVQRRVQAAAGAPVAEEEAR